MRDFLLIEIKTNPRLSPLWKDNLKSSDDIKALDIEIGETFPDLKEYRRPLMPMEIHAMTDPKELVHGTKSTANQMARELAGCNYVQITPWRNAHGKQYGRLRNYGFDPVFGTISN